MKFRSFCRTFPALAGVGGLSLGLSSCATNHTVGYVYVVGTSANGQPAGQIGALRENNNYGDLATVAGSPYGTGGSNPVRAVVPSGNRFLYVLNAGTPATDANGSVTYSSSNISLFTIGGYGQLSPQLTYPSQGSGSERVLTDSSGSHLYVLDKYANVGIAGGTLAPTGIIQNGPTPTYPCKDTDTVNFPNTYHPTGSITVFNIDGSTGRLGVVQNQRQQQLTYFPVGCNPVDFRIAGQYVYTMDAGTASNNDLQTVYVYALNTGTGQLTPTQTNVIRVPLTAPNGTSPTNITAITGDVGGSYVYLLDTLNNIIYQYTVSTSGSLTAVTGSPYNNGGNSQAGGPVQSLTDSTRKYVYVINQGPAGGTTNANSDIGGYSLNGTTGTFDTSTQLSPYAGTVSGPVCIIEDPTNQFIYVAGALDNSITGRRIDPNTGTLTPLRRNATVPTVGTPSWCLSISSAL